MSNSPAALFRQLVVRALRDAVPLLLILLGYVFLAVGLLVLSIKLNDFRLLWLLLPIVLAVGIAVATYPRTR